VLDINKVYQGDCLEVMQDIDNKSIDMILCDLPYGTTACSWDISIPLDKLWEQYNRIIKPTGAICLCGTEPFSSYLRISAIELFKYDWVWEKNQASGFLHSKNKPLKIHELISVFSQGTTVHKTQSKNRMTYNPVMSQGKPYVRKHVTLTVKNIAHKPSKSAFDFIGSTIENKGVRYPTSILKYNSISTSNRIHPTQKPVALFEYLIKTYTNEGGLVLDNCAGSCTTAIAAENLKRNWICIEKELEYCEKGRERIETNRKKSMSLFELGILQTGESNE
jgi:site-specific DNA-methyltransferase (adenine-specific)